MSDKGAPKAPSPLEAGYDREEAGLAGQPLAPASAVRRSILDG